jgi:signal transduction histidine kinase
VFAIAFNASASMLLQADRIGTHAAGSQPDAIPALAASWLLSSTPSAFRRYEVYSIVFVAALVALQAGLCILWFLEKSRRKRSRRENVILNARLISAAEEERKNIARELHDDFAQRLSLLMVGIDELREDVLPRGSFRIREILDGLDKLATDIHQMSHRLHSSRLRHLGLSAALRDVCRSISNQHHIPIDFAVDQDYRELPEHIALCFYRVAQEALNNAVKHSGSDCIEVRLNGHGQDLAMTIVDYGVGFDPHVATEGMGLSSMRERLRMIGGSLQIQSRPGGGTKLQAEASMCRTNGIPETRKSKNQGVRESSEEKIAG